MPSCSLESAVADSLRLADRLRASEAALRESEARYRALFEQAPVGVVLYDTALQVTDCNEAFAALMRSTRERIVGLRIPELRDTGPLASMARSLAGEAPHFEAHYRATSSDHALWIAGRAVPMRDADGTVVGGLAVVEDVTERHAAVERLARSERHFRSLIENVTEMVSVVAPDGTFLYLSPAHARAIGCTPEELVGTSALARIHPDDAADPAAVLARLLETPGSEAGTAHFRYRHKDGSWRTIAAIATNLCHDPAVGGVVVNSRDVTDWVQLEGQLRQSQKMEAVGQLAGGVAHDFNNLLTVILANVELALAGLPAEDPLRADLCDVADAARRAGGLTRQLLAFSRKQRLEPQRLDVRETVSGFATMLRRLIGEEIALECELADCACLVEADPGQLGQVLLNLALNGRDAMPDGGTLRLRTRGVQLAAEGARRAGLPPGDYVALEVEDEGTGIEAAILPHVFEPFFTTKQVGEGTGLGLATVYGIVRQSGGGITVDTVPGAGSRFTVLLPRVDAPAPACAPEPAESAPAGGATVLLVEDEAAVRAVVRRVLERQGYRVLEASNGVEALGVWRAAEGAVELLLTDVVMPEMGGPRLGALLRAERPGLPVLFMSGYDRDGALAQAEVQAPLLHKPVRPVELLARVGEMLRG